jgi:two-component system chemotaxis response regulator CheY
MRHCLVVYDSDVIRKVARRIMELLRFDTTEAANGQEALERCQLHMPDVILLDWQMPEMSGIEFLSSLRLRPHGKKPIVLYCTTENDPIDIARALAAGADEYVLKPFNREAIQTKLADAGLT